MNEQTPPRWIASKIFVKIARDSYEQVVTLKPKLEEAASRVHTGAQQAIDEWGELHNTIVMQCCIAIVFAATAAEAYIYDYGARGMSDTFVKQYLDKLDLLAKWVVIPQMVKGRAFPRGGQGIELLKKLVTARNGLVHFKSGSRGNAIQVKELVANAAIAIRTLDALIEDMSKFDPHELPELQLPKKFGWTESPGD